jgi:PAS domain S-box-containing protein
MTKLLKEKADTVPDFFSMVMFDRDCVFTATATGNNTGVKSKPELCEARKRHSGSGPLVSYVPGKKSASGKSVLVLSRHLKSSTGDFLGGVLGAIELDIAQKLFDLPGLDPVDSVALLDEERILLARYPLLAEALEKPASLAIPAELFSTERVARVAVEADIDGRERIFGFSKVEGFPFFVAFGFDKAEVTEGWRWRVVELATGYFILLLLALMFARAHWTTLRQREDLRASQEHFHTLFESTSDTVMVLDANGFIECNGATIKMFGCPSRESFVKLPLADLSPAKQSSGDDSASLLKHYIDKAQGESGNRFDWTFQRLDNGHTFPADVLLNPIRVNGQVAIEAVVRDISERKSQQLELERRVLARTEELATARVEAESANAVKTRFMANVSHEMRTPMNGIIGFAEIGKRKAAKNSAEMYADYFDNVLVSAKSLNQLIESLLNLAETAWDEQSGIAKDDLQVVELEMLAAQCVSLMEKTAASRQQKIELECSAKAPCVLGDESRLQQVLNHLFSNALRYSPEHSSVIVRIQDMPDAPARAPRVRIQVIDQGCGIPEKELKAIFEPFYESTRTATGAGGTGLGLALSTQIIHRHKGTITAANQPGCGAIFEIILPRSD